MAAAARPKFNHEESPGRALCRGALGVFVTVNESKLKHIPLVSSIFKKKCVSAYKVSYSVPLSKLHAAVCSDVNPDGDL